MLTINCFFPERILIIHVRFVNYLDVSLTSVALKVLMSVVLHRHSTTRETLSREKQTVFHLSYGSSDQIFTIRRRIEQRFFCQRTKTAVSGLLLVLLIRVQLNYLLRNFIPE